MKYPAPILLLLGIVLLCLSACNEYDEGPAISLRSKTKRVTNNWRIDSATKNGLDATAEVRINANFKDDGILVYRDTVASPDGDVVTTLNGVWEFDHDADNLLLVFTNPGGGAASAKIWYILRRTSDDLWVTETIGEDLYRYEFIPK